VPKGYVQADVEVSAQQISHLFGYLFINCKGNRKDGYAIQFSLNAIGQLIVLSEHLKSNINSICMHHQIVNK